MAELLRLPRGGIVFLSPCNALDYLRAYQPLCLAIDAAFRRCGQSFGDLLLDSQGWELLRLLLDLFGLELGEFENAWPDLEALVMETLPGLHQVPTLEFARLSTDKSQGSGDAVADLISSLPEGIDSAMLERLDMASIYRIQWLNNQAAQKRLTPKDKDEIATAIAMEKVGEDAIAAQQKWLE
jgi:hypothetical protein